MPKMSAEVEWHDATDSEGMPTREFRISRAGKRDITGALWLPGSTPACRTLICVGHGASGDRYQAPICSLAARFVDEIGLPVLSLDGPVHGLRQVGDGGRGAFFPEFQRDGCMEDMVDDWTCAVFQAQSLAAIGIGNLAYFGLSMGSLFGIPFLASRDDVTVAALGLVGVESGFPHDQILLDAATKIDCPLVFLMQLEDELFVRDGYLKVFDAFASVDKRLHANPGLHPQIPGEEIDFVFEFLAGHVNGTVERSIINPLAE